MAPRWGYKDYAPLGLQRLRPAGATKITPRWGYRDYAPLGLQRWRPAGATKITPRWGYGDGAPLGMGSFLFEGLKPLKSRRDGIFVAMIAPTPPEPRRGDIIVAPAGRYLFS